MIWIYRYLLGFFYYVEISIREFDIGNIDVICFFVRSVEIWNKLK